MDGRTIAERTVEVLGQSERRHHRAAGGDWRGTRRYRTRGDDRRRPRHGLGDGVGSPSARPPVRQRRAVALPDPPARAIRPVVADVRTALLPAGGYRDRRPNAAPLQCASRHGVPRTEGSGRAARDDRARCPDPSAENPPRRFQRVEPGTRDRRPHKEARRPSTSAFTCDASAPTRACFRSCISITSTTRAKSTSSASKCRARENH